MTFGEALENLKKGKFLARRGWNGRGMFIYYTEGSEPRVEDLRGNAKKAWMKGSTKLDNALLLPHIDMFTHDSSGRTAILCGWLASQSDMLSEDWEIVEG